MTPDLWKALIGAIDPATIGTGSYAKLYATDQKVDYHSISGNRMFIAFTNVTLNI